MLNVKLSWVGINTIEIWVQVITQFLKMETLLDDSVDQPIELQIERGGTSLTVNLRVRFALAYILLFLC